MPASLPEYTEMEAEEQSQKQTLDLCNAKIYTVCITKQKGDRAFANGS
jgi:hypothetical protein